MFDINGVEWEIYFVPPYSPWLRYNDGSYTVGMTDRDMQEIYLSDELYGEYLENVLSHEICHAAAMSYGVDMDAQDEECMCQFVERHSDEVNYLTDELLGQL